MKRTTMYVSLAGALLFSAAAFGISSAVDIPRTLMSRNDYSVAKSAIESESRVAFGACRDLEGIVKDICKTQVRSDLRIQLAELNARYYGTVAAANDARVARARSRYELAKAQCGTHSGSERSECVKLARADKDKALADAKAQLASI